jgi:hypothetical protein
VNGCAYSPLRLAWALRFAGGDMYIDLIYSVTEKIYWTRYKVFQQTANIYKELAQDHGTNIIIRKNVAIQMSERFTRGLVISQHPKVA